MKALYHIDKGVFNTIEALNFFWPIWDPLGRNKKQTFCLVFGSIENKKICFWNYWSLGLNYVQILEFATCAGQWVKKMLKFVINSTNFWTRISWMYFYMDFSYFIQINQHIMTWVGGRECESWFVGIWPTWILMKLHSRPTSPLFLHSLNIFTPCVFHHHFC